MNTPVPEELNSLNKLFLDGYAERQANMRTNRGPLIIASFSSLILDWNGRRETNRVIPPLYHSLKAIAHAPFGLYLQLSPHTANEELPGPTLQALTNYQARLSTAIETLPSAGFSEAQLKRQEALLQMSIDFSRSAIASKLVSSSQLLQFCRKAGPLMLENASEAADAQIELTHSSVMKWREQIPLDEWNNLVVVIRGFQMPRRHNIFSVYFAKVISEPSHRLGYPLESRRLIYAEFISDKRDHLDLMATTFIDGNASEAFFGDRWKLSSDILADGAKAAVRRLDFKR